LGRSSGFAAMHLLILAKEKEQWVRNTFRVAAGGLAT